MSVFRMECASSSPDGVIKSGDEAVFSVMVFRDDSPDWGGAVEYTLNRGWDRPLEHGLLKLAPGGNRVRVTVDAPGMCQCFFRREDGGAVLTASAGVIADPEKLTPRFPEPPDFDDFWRARRLPPAGEPELRLEPVSGGLAHGEMRSPRSGDDGEMFAAEIYRPAGAGKRSLPGVITFHGAGVRSPGYASSGLWAERGFLSIEVPAHRLEIFRAPEYYRELAAGALAEYHRSGLMGEDPAQCYFLPMLLRAARAVELAAMLPEWDGENLFVTGGSQGGWQALAAAALDSRVSAAGVWIPAGCDIVAGNWPCCGSREAEKPRERRYAKIVPYFDAANFLRRITCPVGVFAGLADPVCHPDGIAAAFNGAPRSSRRLRWFSGMGHEDNPIAISAAEEFLLHCLHRVASV